MKLVTLTREQLALRQEWEKETLLRRIAAFAAKIAYWFAGGAGAALVLILWLYSYAQPADSPRNEKYVKSLEREQELYKAANAFLGSELESATQRCQASERELELWRSKYSELTKTIDDLEHPTFAGLPYDEQKRDQFERQHDYSAEVIQLVSAERTKAAAATTRVPVRRAIAVEH